MAKKTFCDLCGKEIPSTSRVFDISVFDEKRDRTISEREACGRCVTRVHRALNFLARQAPRVTAVLLLVALTWSAAGARPFYKDKKFWLGLAVDSAAMAADYKTSQDLFARGGTELNPIFGSRRPGSGRMVAIGLPLTAAVAFVGHRIGESKHSKLWWIPSALDGGDHVVLAIHNGQVCPAGARCR